MFVASLDNLANRDPRIVSVKVVDIDAGKAEAIEAFVQILRYQFRIEKCVWTGVAAHSNVSSLRSNDHVVPSIFPRGLADKAFTGAFAVWDPEAIAVSGIDEVSPGLYELTKQA
jgi:hypothetical protein